MHQDLQEQASRCGREHWERGSAEEQGGAGGCHHRLGAGGQEERTLCVDDDEGLPEVKAWYDLCECETGSKAAAESGAGGARASGRLYAGYHTWLRGRGRGYYR
jgi:hypothetical protein